ncbi:MAG: cadmium-translocating P-type ATPase [Ruminococcaceae bacterium]|jgi:Cd2+/Zn2+-exporting ATPase|nr:cadmium-translocating P-type ATPase [Oscillospiraceae bacterium]
MGAKQKRELNKILLTAALFLCLLLADRLHLAPAIFENRWLSLALYLVPYLLCGAPVLRKALLGIKNRQMFDESFLMTVATVGAFAIGENAEAAAVMLFYQVGEWFQGYAVGRSRRSITELMDIVPESANVERPGGTVETVDPDEVAVGDVLVIRPGERIPVDGTVLSGESLINTAALTGEPVPRAARSGDAVISGCINGDGLLRVRAEKAFEDSAVTRILELVETASEKKSRTESFITRFARYYTPIVVCTAVLLAIFPPLFAGGWATWIYRACAFLVISCPCALVISVPLAFFGGIGAASRGGVLVKGSNYLELMAQVRTLVSDKTGTLTMGDFRVAEVLCAPGVKRGTVLHIAALAEGLSTHPIAQSIREALGERETDLSAVTSVENVSGRGLIASVSGRRILVGSDALLASEGIVCPAVSDNAATVCRVAEDGRYLGAILIRDQVKPEAREAVSALRTQGVDQIIMLTGDRRAAGDAVGRELGVDRICAELLPAGKVAQVEALLAEQKEGKLAFVGDGINDAPVLARSDVGIAMGSLGSDAAIEAADVVIMDDDLRRIASVMGIARRTVAIARQNIVFALAVKLIVLVLSAFGVANMWTAVFADVGVAVLCILNSMRLLTVKRTI